MVSINTNSSNAYVLSNLRQINNDITVSQTRIGTGKKINSASDNASVWTIAQNIRAEQKAQDGTGTGIGIAKARADVAVAALSSAATILGQMKELANQTTAANPTTSADLDAATAKFVALKTQLTATLSSASFQNENWITGTVANLTSSVAIGFSGSTATTVSAGLVKQDDTSTNLTLLKAVTSISKNVDAATATAKNGADLAAAIDAVASQLSAYQTTLSTFSSSLAVQQDFQKALTSIRDSAISSLVDADLEEESAKVTALQVKQQLAYQALAITNSSSQNILRLFQ